MLVTVGEGQATNAEGALWRQGPGQQEVYRWQSAWMTENRPWFQVHVKGKEEGATEHIVLAPPLPEFETWFPSQCSEMEIVVLMLVSPPWLNRSAYWRMDPVRDISCVETFDRKRQKGILYELQERRRPLLDAPYSLETPVSEHYAIYSTDRPALIGNIGLNTLER
ncbi:hypothetical protein [Chromohalobacter canadensis]|uniref:Uncharacterized protein n=2 Tax=Chromohalobacter TaxID=42054 RepID=A0ABZ0Y7V2_9GAMM|nr:hypothetical protein [Chromohalobacter canadensis]MCK0770309.1 hypothetical protein [Chromohalobacter canadensis]WQH07773.1 hypothetical protein SR908_09710 [Chromohalobacter canadensis]